MTNHRHLRGADGVEHANHTGRTQHQVRERVINKFNNNQVARSPGVPTILMPSGHNGYVPPVEHTTVVPQHESLPLKHELDYAHGKLRIASVSHGTSKKQPRTRWRAGSLASYRLPRRDRGLIEFAPSLLLGAPRTPVGCRLSAAPCSFVFLRVCFHTTNPKDTLHGHVVHCSRSWYPRINPENMLHVVHGSVWRRRGIDQNKTP